MLFMGLAACQGAGLPRPAAAVPRPRLETEGYAIEIGLAALHNIMGPGYFGYTLAISGGADQRLKIDWENSRYISDGQGQSTFGLSRARIKGQGQDLVLDIIEPGGAQDITLAPKHAPMPTLAEYQTVTNLSWRENFLMQGLSGVVLIFKIGPRRYRQEPVMEIEIEKDEPGAQKSAP